MNLQLIIVIVITIKKSTIISDKSHHERVITCYQTYYKIFKPLCEDRSFSLRYLYSSSYLYCFRSDNQ